MTVRVQRHGAVGRIVLDDAATRNALDEATVTALSVALATCEADCRAIILTGAGTAFCAGARLTAAAVPIGSDHDAGALLGNCFHPLISQIAALRVPLVVAVNGVAAGGGMGLALSGDIVVASDAARFVPAFAAVGLVPDCGVSRALVQAVGRTRAAEILLLGEPVDAQAALAMGLVNRVVAVEALTDTALLLAERLAAGPTIALGLTRRLLWQAGLEEALHRERVAQTEAGRSADHAEAIRGFLAKRSARFTGS